MTLAPGMLTPHFSFSEMTRTNVRPPDGFTGAWNQPGPDERAALLYLATVILEPVRAHFGMVVIGSGYRSPEVNAAVRGQPTSQHMRGEAADFEVPGVHNITLANWIRDNLPNDYDQIIAEFCSVSPAEPSAGWVHCSAVAGRPLRRITTTLDLSGVRPGLPVLA